MKDINTITEEMLESYSKEEIQNALDILSDLEYVTGKGFKEPMKILSDMAEEL